MNATSDWLTAVVILAVGLVLGLIGIVVINRRKTAAALKPRPVLKGFVWGVMATTAAGLVGYYAQQAAPPPSAAAPRVAATRNDPDTIDHHIALAKASLEQNDLMAVFEHSKAALAKDPNEPRALTYNALVRMAMGQTDDARAMLEKATRNDPKLLDAWVALASVRMQTGDAKAASAAIDAAIQQHPEEGTRLRAVLTQLKRPAAPAPLPPGHPPTAPAPAAQSNAPAIHITLAIQDPARANTGIVYVIARQEGESSGHPVAVKRINTPSFPMTLDLGAADSMMGQPLPPKVHLEARLDSDGDAGTTELGDPKAFVNGVTAGQTVTLTLK